MKYLILTICLFTCCIANAANLGMTKEQFISAFQIEIMSKNLNDNDKKKLSILKFGPSTFSDNSQSAVVSNCMIVLADPDKDGVIDNAIVIYPAPKGGMDSNDITVRFAFLSAVLGEKNAHSSAVKYVSSTTGTRNEGKRIKTVDGFIVASTISGNTDNSQLIVVTNKNNKNPEKSRSVKKESSSKPGVNYFN